MFDLTSSFKNYTLLYVEDDTSLQKEALKVFNKIFYKVYLANDGLDGLRVLRENSIDLIITDIKMPKLNGIEMVRAIRETNPNIPVILTSAYDDSGLLKSALKLNVTFFIEKPYNLDELSRVFESISKLLNLEKNIINLGDDITFNLTSLELKKASIPIALSPQERRLLKILAKNMPNVVTYEVLEYEIATNLYTSKDALRVAIGNLRKKIGKDIIKNRSKEGYYICNL